jgi:hypothetical protein
VPIQNECPFGTPRSNIDRFPQLLIDDEKKINPYNNKVGGKKKYLQKSAMVAYTNPKAKDME